MPATKTKSPALAPRLHVPSVLIAPGRLSVLTPWGEGACAKPRLAAMAIAVTKAKASRGNIGAPRLDRLFDPPRRMRAGGNDGQRIRASPLRKRDQPSFPHPEIVGAPPEGTHAPDGVNTHPQMTRCIARQMGA